MTTAPYGTWPSPLTAALAATHDGRPEYLDAVGDEVWWTAPRPREGGRRALVRLRPDGTEESVLPPPWNVRNRVIEYGGRPWAGAPRPDGGPLIVFTHFADQRLYAYEPDAGGEPRPLTPVSAVGGGLRWCDAVVLPERGEAWCVLEEFTGPSPTDVRRVLAAVPLDGSAAADRTAVRELTDDRHRFVTGPRLSPDGRQVAWIAWDHPRMPWDGTELRVADVTGDGRLAGVTTVLGAQTGPEAESVAQAEWLPDGTLVAATDRSGWWNLHRVDPATAVAGELCPLPEEFADALWKVGLRWFAVLGNGLVATLHGTGGTRLGVLDPATGELADVPGPWSNWAGALAVTGERVFGLAASPVTGYEVVELDTATGYARVAGNAHRDAVDPAYLPRPESRTFAGPDGREVHAHVYPPRHPESAGPAGELPPYVIWAHGGPTGHVPLVLDLEIAYFTSRGIGVAEVNYGGSTGYGRAYRERLREQWGVVDVEDCAAVARALAAEGTADPARLAIRGGSAGGWTTAASLTSPLAEGLYACGTIIYPILDLAGWATDETHDFESRYLESLVGPLAEVPERYRERSPVHHADRIAAPFLLLQGLDDVICPPVQCERFLAALAGRGVPHAYVTFEGEGHGFRRADTLTRALEAELSLYAQTFGFAAPDVPAVDLGAPVPPAAAPARAAAPAPSSAPGTASSPGTGPATGSAAALVRPRRLRPGDRVAVVAPSGGFPRKKLDAGVEVLRGWGLDVVVHPTAYGKHGVLSYLAADDAARARDFERAWCDPEVAAVFSGSGGYGAQRMVDHVDWAALRAAGPKLYAGFSDATALHEAVATHLGVATLYGPMPAWSPFVEDDATREHLRRTLFEPAAVQRLTNPGARALVPGRARGVTLGGCVSLLAAGVGTPGAHAGAAGGILLIEDVEEEDYRLDRILTQLRRSGWLTGVAGVACGTWADCGPYEDVRAVLADRLGDLGVPVLEGLDFGHGVPALTVPLGVPAVLDADAGTLTLDTPGLA